MKSGRIRKLIIALAAVVLITAAFVVLYIEGAFLPRWINWERDVLTTSDGNLTAVLDGRKLTVSKLDVGKIALGESGVSESGVSVSGASASGEGDSKTSSATDAEKGQSSAKDIVWQLPRRCKAQSVLLADIDGDKRDEMLVLCWRIGRYGKRRPFWVKHDEPTWSQHIYIYDINGDSVKAKWMASDIGILVDDWEIEADRFLTTYSPDGSRNSWAWISWGLERIPDEVVDNTLNGDYLRKIRDGSSDEEDATNTDDNHESVIDENSESTENTENTENTESSNSVSIIMAGDVILHTGVAEACKLEDGTYDFHPLFENTKDIIEGADLAIVNQEVIIGGRELGVTGYPSFNAPYELADALADTGFDVICHATNHALDKGRKGLMRCIDYWKNNYPDIGVIGIYGSQSDSEEVYITAAGGIKIAILNYTYGTNGIPLPSDMPFAVNLLADKDRILADLEYAEANADFTIVCPHWGIEYQLDYNKEQQSWAEFFVENGADLIIATHPHVIEPVEWVEADNGNKGLCYYSLGNYINWTSGRGGHVADRMVGAMADVTIESATDGQVVIADYDAIPTVSHVEHTRGKVTTFLLNNYSEELSLQNAIREQDSQFSLEYCRNLWESVIAINRDLD